MGCDNCGRLEKRLQELEQKIAQLTGAKPPEPKKEEPKAAPPPPPPPEPPKPSGEPPPPPGTVKSDEAEKLAALGIPVEEHGYSVRALQEYPKGLAIVAPFLQSKILKGTHVYHAAYAAEKYGKEPIEKVLTKLVGPHNLEHTDLPHATESVRQYGPDATEMAIQMGYRKRDIIHAAEVIRMWPHPMQGRTALEKMKKLFTKVRADIYGEDLRYCAMTYKNLGEELLECGIRDRHPKNEREPWAQGISIPLIAWAYKLSAPHAGGAIDECRSRNSRRDRIGMEVLSVLGRRFGRKVQPPPWLGGGKD